jgi:hypothetical protein
MATTINLNWFLVALLVFEFFFALDCFKQKLRARKDFESAMAFANTVATDTAKALEEKEGRIAGLTESLKSRVSENNYLRDLLDQHGIEWESGWRKLS